MRYCKQYTKTDCGPISALNALKWAGESLTLSRGYKKLRTRCNWERGFGTNSVDIIKELKRYQSIKIKSKISPTMKDLDSHLEKGWVFILRYTHLNGKGGHFSFCYGKKGKFFLFYNDSSITFNKKRSRKTVNRYLRKKLYKTGEKFPARAIFISKLKI